MHNWFIVQLVEDEETHIIPSVWLRNSKTTTAWPSHPRSCEDFQRSIKEREEPESDWSERGIAKILKITGNVTGVIINCVQVNIQ